MNIDYIYNQALETLEELGIDIPTDNLKNPRVESRDNFDRKRLSMIYKGKSRFEQVGVWLSANKGVFYNSTVGGITYPILAEPSANDNGFRLDYQIVLPEDRIGESTSGIDAVIAEALAIGVMAHELGHVWMFENTAYGKSHKNFLTLMLNSEKTVTRLLRNLEARDFDIASQTDCESTFSKTAPMGYGISTIRALAEFAKYGDSLKKYDRDSTTSEAGKLVGLSEDEYHRTLEEGIETIYFLERLGNLSSLATSLNEGWCEYINQNVMIAVLSQKLQSTSIGTDSDAIQKAINSWRDRVQSAATIDDHPVAPYDNGLALFNYFPDFQTALKVAQTVETDSELAGEANRYIPKRQSTFRDRLVKAVRVLAGREI